MAAARPVGIAVWEWLNEFGRWRPYDPNICDFIEQKKSSSLHIHLGGADPTLVNYTLDLQNLIQIRAGTGTKRMVRRKVYPMQSAVAQGIRWQWEDNAPGRYHEYDFEITCYIEDAYQNKIPLIDLSMTQFNLPYTLDLTRMTQTRNETRNKRHIKRSKIVNSYHLEYASNGPQLSGNVTSNSGRKFNGAMTGGSSTAGSVSGSVSSLKHTHSDSGDSDNGQAKSLKPKKKSTKTVSSTKSSSSSSIPPVAVGPPNPHGASSNSNILTRSQVHGLSSAGSSSGSASFHGNLTTGLQPGMPLMSSSMSMPAGVGQLPSHISLQQGHRFLGRHISPAITGVTNTLVNPLLPVVLSAPQPPLYHPPPASKSTMKPVQGIEGTKRKNTGKQNLEAGDVMKKYVVKVKSPPNDEDCCICMSRLSANSGYDDSCTTVYQLKKCTHMFHKSCIEAMYSSGSKDGHVQCPTCKTIYGEKYGNCPPGKMEFHTLPQSVPGYPGSGTIRIIYSIHGGIQGPEHPHPGQAFSARGFPRHCYLPDSEEGRKVLKLLIVAWERRLTFTIGSSTTTGEGNTVTWNEIHHKTEWGSNSTAHGYPDPNYLTNVTMELAVHGVTESDISE